eukprot:UC4_evm1s1454
MTSPTMEKHLPALPTDLPDLVRKGIALSWTKDPKKRLTAANLAAMCDPAVVAATAKNSPTGIESQAGIASPNKPPPPPPSRRSGPAPGDASPNKPPPPPPPGRSGPAPTHAENSESNSTSSRAPQTPKLATRAAPNKPPPLPPKPNSLASPQEGLQIFSQIFGKPAASFVDISGDLMLNSGKCNTVEQVQAVAGILSSNAKVEGWNLDRGRI